MYVCRVPHLKYSYHVIINFKFMASVNFQNVFVVGPLDAVVD